MVPDLAAELQIVPGAAPYRYGATYMGALARPVPRTLWPGKPTAADTQLMDRLWPALAAQHVLFTFSFFGEPFWNFGFAGVVAISALFGIAWRTLYEWYQRAPRNRTVIAIYALSWPFLFVYMRGGIGVDYQRQLIAVLPIVVAAFFARRHSPRTARMPQRVAVPATRG
jgi:oligosaccharide repeat unit polymerase